MTDMAMIAGAVTSLRSAYELSKALVGVRDTALFNDKIIELQRVILAAQSDAISAQSDQFTLLELIRELKKQVADLEKWDAEKQKYELAEITSGVFAYALKATASPAEPKHLICANCYEQGHKSILQTETRFPGRYEVGVCHACTAEIVLNGTR